MLTPQWLSKFLSSIDITAWRSTGGSASYGTTMRRSRAKDPKTRPCTSRRSVALIGRYFSRSAICGKSTEYTSMRPVNDPAMMARARSAKKVMLPANFIGTDADVPGAPGGRKRSAPEDGACPINDRSGLCALLFQDIECLGQLIIRLRSFRRARIVIILLAGGDHDIRRYRLVLNLLAQGRSILGDGKDQRSAIGKFHGLLHGAFTEGSVSHHVASLVIENRRGNNLSRPRGAMVHQNRQGRSGNELGGIGVKGLVGIFLP